MKAASGLKAGSCKARTGINKQPCLCRTSSQIDLRKLISSVRLSSLASSSTLFMQASSTSCNQHSLSVRMSYREELKQSSLEKKLQLEDKLSIINDTDLLDEDKVVLALCALVDLIFIPERKTQCSQLKRVSSQFERLYDNSTLGGARSPPLTREPWWDICLTDFLLTQRQALGVTDISPLGPG